MTEAILLILYGSLILAAIVGFLSAVNEPWEGLWLPVTSALLAFMIVWGLVAIWFAIWMVAKGVWYFMSV